jgi:hypothetical protein
MTPEQRAEQAEKEVAFLRWMAQRAQVDIDALKAEMPLLRQDIERLIGQRDAAVAVVEIVRRGFGTAEDVIKAEAFDPVALTRAIEAYDKALG